MNAKILDDADLVDQLVARKEPALEELYTRYSANVYGLARRVLRNDDLAQEVVQDVFIWLWKKPDGFDPARGSLKSYLLARTHSRSIDIIRSESSRRIREERDARFADEEASNLEEEVWHMSLSEKVKSALASLPDRERQPIELAYFGGLTYRDVATRLDMPEGTVKSRIRTGMVRLNQLMRQAGVEGI